MKINLRINCINLCKILSYLVFCLCIVSCSKTTVRPWEKEFLAKKIMQIDPDPLEAKFKQHIFDSKEGASGGYGVAGGGCGCS